LLKLLLLKDKCEAILMSKSQAAEKGKRRL
jgi:hypothetical protein